MPENEKIRYWAVKTKIVLETKLKKEVSLLSTLLDDIFYLLKFLKKK